MLNDWSRKIVRARINQHLTDSCIVKRYRDDIGTYGEPIETLVSSTTYACHLSRRNRGSETELTGADMGRVYYMLQLPYDADIQDGDAVTVDGVTYQTVQVYERQSVDVMKQALIVRAGS